MDADSSFVQDQVLHPFPISKEKENNDELVWIDSFSIKIKRIIEVFSKYIKIEFQVNQVESNSV